MKRILFAVVMMSLFVPMKSMGQTYKSMWKEVEAAQKKDLPQTAMVHLRKIESQAAKDKAYGQLLKASLLYAKSQADIAPDSMAPAVRRLEQKEQQTKDVALKAVYDAVLSKIYGDNRQLGDDWQARRDDYCRRALEHPEALAKVQADDYVPFVVKGNDSQLYGHDLLSVVGAELNAWEVLNRYYDQSGNAPAACLTALEHLRTVRPSGQYKLAEARYIQQLDSLLTVYGSLAEAGEVAIERYQFMASHTDATGAERQAWLTESLQRWGSWRRANVLRNEQKALNNPAYKVQIAQPVGEVNQPQTVKLTFLRHLQGLTMRVYRTKLAGDTKLRADWNKDYEQIKGGLSELTNLSRTLSFEGHADYEVFTDSLVLGALPAGVYLLEFATQPGTEVTRMLYFVSGLRVMMQAQPGNKMRYVVVDATTGQPVAKAKLRLSFNAGWGKPEKTETCSCDKGGELVYDFDKQTPSSVYAYTDKDNSCPPMNSYGRYTYYERQFIVNHVNLFTDRAVYRPGQRVHVTAIVWNELSVLENMAESGRKLTLELRDANYKLVGEQTVTTDSYGKGSATFTLPSGVLNGRFSIRTTGGGASFRVEEYKRPAFQVEFEDYDKPYQNGDVVKVQGKALTYAGVPVQGAQVKYTVKRRIPFWWMTYSWYWKGGYNGMGLQETVVSEGHATTADDGTFDVEMPMVLPEDLGGHAMFYHFVAEAEVTDVAGETHSGTVSLPLGNKPSALTCDLPQQVRRDQLPQVTFRRYNAAGRDIEGTVSYRVDDGKWQQGAANTRLSVLSAQLKSGEHRLQAVCEQDTLDMTFVVFGLDDKKPASPTHDWFYVSHQEFPADGQPVTLQVGASDPNLYIVYSIFANDKQLESGVVTKNAALLNRQFTYKKEYADGLLLTYAWVKNGQCHTHQAFIRRPMPDKKLTLAWETFRDRLTPGQQEEWRLTVKNADGSPATASLMAVLYDKSLDAITPHRWSFEAPHYISQPSTGWMFKVWNSSTLSGAQKYQMLDVADFSYSRFDESVFPEYRYMTRFNRMSDFRTFAAAPMMKEGAPMMKASAQVASTADEVKVETAAVETVMAKDNAKGTLDATDADQAADSDNDVVVRENLNETAFCYPAVESDQEGGVTLRFTLPESLTTWRFMGIANTKDMSYGSITGEAVAKKDVMVQPNVPRFVRVGDEATIAARIFNTSSRDISGQAKIQLIDPETETVVFEQEQSFTAATGQTVATKFNIQSAPFSGHSLLICKVTVRGDGFSDGEQHYLPVLPNQEYVTKTVPFTQHQPGTRRIDLGSLFPQGTTQRKLTVEYTNDPAWLMVQSLPVIGQPWEYSAIDMAASFYSNALAKSLLDINQQVKTVFERWKREQGSETSLMSQLQKNQELKDVVLAETPWVAVAEREADQKQSLVDFFDENDINNRQATAYGKLKELQHADGSFSWYPGMAGSTSITLTVTEMLVRLSKMTDVQFDMASLNDKAIDYLGQEMKSLVDRMKKEEKKGRKPSFPSFDALRWLYICALDGRALPADVLSANDYLINLLQKDIKRQTIYEKALTAVVLAKCDKQKRAAEYVRSLKEYTVYTEELGRYYDTPRAAYSWYDYKIPTEVAAIEAIRMVTPDDQQTIDEMRRWLLQEKRTQAWDTPVSTVNAIWAFMSPESPTCVMEPMKPATLAIDGQPLQLSAATAGLGYVKTAISDPKGKTFTADKTSEGTSWGAVYAQFMQPTHDVAASSSGITVKRELLTTDAGQPTPVTQLTVGSRVKVRITIETTRDLDFVQVVDRRAACMEPVRQLSGYRNGAYVSPKDNATHYFYHGLAKGKHVIESEYYIDRAGRYETGTCTVGCAYATEYRATAPSVTVNVNE
ncbi:MAG: alpha-2-macroglobulin [Prevotella sp.]|nr:alpha-2-macroglobulin [Prevotella sp.]